MFSFSRLIKYELSFFAIFFTYRFLFGRPASGISLSEILILCVFLAIFLIRSRGKTRPKNDSYWERMNIVSKIIVTIIIIPLLYLVIYASFYIIGAILLLIIIGFGLAGQRRYNRTMRDAETRGNIEEIRQKLGDINSKL